MKQALANTAVRRCRISSRQTHHYQWSDGVEMGIHNVLDGTGVELKFVRMDTKSNPDEAFGKKSGQQVAKITSQGLTPGRA